MPKVVYYKNYRGIVRGPQSVEDMTNLYKSGVFPPGLVFRVVDDAFSEEFKSIVHLQSLNGFETPFGPLDDGHVSEEGELERVRGELERVREEIEVLHGERVSLFRQMEMMRAREEELRQKLVAAFYETIKDTSVFACRHVIREGRIHTSFTNNSAVAVRCLFATRWDPFNAKVVGAKETVLFEESGGPSIHLAPHLSDDVLDGDEHVYTMPNPNTQSVSTFEYSEYNQ